MTTKRAVRKKLRSVNALFRTRKKHFGEDRSAGMWVTYRNKQPVEVPIESLQNQHLLNAIRKLETHAELFQKHVLATGISVHKILRRETVPDYSERDLKRIRSLSPLDFLMQETIYPQLYAEARQRGLPLPPIGEWGGAL